MIIDNFNRTLLKNNKLYDKLIKDINFVKYQEGINNMLIKYIETIPDKSITDIVTSAKNKAIVLNLIKKYACYYFFLNLGMKHKEKKKSFINNIIEFTKNQSGFQFKVDEFFNSSSNGNIIKYYGLTNTIKKIMGASKSQLEQLKKNEQFVQVMKLLNEYGRNIVQTFKLEHSNGNENIQHHNIIKTILLKELYLRQDKLEVYELLNEEEKKDAEYIFIDIVVPKKYIITHSVIESILDKNDVNNGYINIIYNMLLEEDIKVLSLEEKINKLLESKLVVPIVEDFLLYHKDTELYDRDIKMGQASSVQQKNNTKIKYIISKIDKVSDLYSTSVKKNQKLTENIQNMFYKGLPNRNAILINDYDEQMLLYKQKKMSIMTEDIKEYYNDLRTFRNYSYQNFKQLDKVGLYVVPNKTTTALRKINFNKPNSNILNTRIINSNNPVNVVGLSFNLPNRSYECFRTNQLVDINQIKTNKNKYIIASNIIANMVHNNNKKKRVPLYWFFNPKTDVYTDDKYNVKNNENINIKLMLSGLYDILEVATFDKIKNVVKKKKTFTLEQLSDIIKQAKNQYKVFNDVEYISELNNYVMKNKLPKAKAEYDTKEDIFYGIDGTVNDLPKFPGFPKPFVDRYDIDIHDSIIKDKKDINVIYNNAVCQHNITWDNMHKLKKDNPQLYSDDLIDFIARYAMENMQGDFVCKSCGTLLDIKQYVEGGTFDSNNNYISPGAQVLIPVEEIRGYKQYDQIIKNVYKYIDKLAEIANLTHLLEKSKSLNAIKLRLTKNVIDIILTHNINIEDSYKKRTTKISDLYGINNQLTNFFVFTMDNQIFTFSSKDKDKYKPIKRNNILLYTLFLMILEISDTQLLYLGNDKLCNMFLYEKFGSTLFSGLKIIVDKNKTTRSISQYPILCYIIFFMSCVISKYRIWQLDADDSERQSKKFSVVVQKIVIHSLVDMINSIIETSSDQNNKSNLYNLISIKFIQNLSGMYSSKDYMDKINNIYKSKYIKKNNKKISKISSVGAKALLVKEYSEDLHQGSSEWIDCKVLHYPLPLRDIKEPEFVINQDTNCPTGDFHNWKLFKDTLKCSKCGMLTIDAKNNKYESNDKHANFILNKYLEKMCFDGYNHNFVNNKCVKCGYDSKKNTDDKFLSYFENRRMQYIKSSDIVPKFIEKNKGNALSELYKNYGSGKSAMSNDFINKFINKIKSIIGNTVTINNKVYNMETTLYVIKHDHKGYTLKEPFIISSKDNKIKFQKNHPFFKKDVLYYINNKIGAIIFYDAFTRILLGYKLKSKEMERVTNQKVFLNINYSFIDQLKLLGYSSNFIDVSEYMKINNQNSDIKEMKEKEKEKIMINIIKDISRERIENLKKTIRNIQKYIHRLKYRFKFPQTSAYEEEIDDFLKSYEKSLTKIILCDRKGNNVFANWKNVVNSVNYVKKFNNKDINIKINNSFVDVNDVQYYDYSGNILLFYIIQELNKLIDYNDHKYTKANLLYLTINIINNMHNLFNTEYHRTSFIIKKFQYIMTSQRFTDETNVEINEKMQQIVGPYDEYIHADEEIDEGQEELDDILREEVEALDIERNEDNDEGDDIDYQIDY